MLDGEGIYLYYDKSSFIGYVYDEFADCYIDDRLEYYGENRESNERLGEERSSVCSINICQLTEDSFGKIISIITKKENDDKIKELPIRIIPKDSKDLALFTTDKIKNICSALEVEMDATKIKISKDAELKELIDSVVKIIKQHESNKKNGIPIKTYSTMYGSIGHWGDSLADRAVEAWHKYGKYLKSRLEKSGINISDDNIASMIHTRNNMTHNGIMGIDDKCCETAFVIMGLTYVMALKRVQIPNEVITEAIARGLIS